MVNPAASLQGVRVLSCLVFPSGAGGFGVLLSKGEMISLTPRVQGFISGVLLSEFYTF